MLRHNDDTMNENDTISKAIRHFKCMKDNAVVTLDSGFGTHPGESDLVYRNRKIYAELAINALEKQILKKPVLEGDGYADGHLVYDTWICPNCEENYEVDYDEYYFCPKCGQAIDWSAADER